ncbi:MAG TPA: DUF1206 domain-containing protein [Micromonosporaceae bacterium]|jgi:hypothetical protein
MTATSVAGTARRAGHSKPLVALTRMGFIGYGLFHLAIAWLALQIALGHADNSGDQSGAFQLLNRQPGGKVLLIVIIVGLIAMAIWQILLAAVGESKTFERVASLARTVVYGFLAYTAIKVASGTPTSSSQQQKKATAGVLSHTAGQILVGLAGVAVVAVAIGMIYYGLARKFESKLMMQQMSAKVRAVVTRLGQVGYTSKGIALGIVGVLLFVVAWLDSKARSSGLDAALHTLSKQPFGRVLLILIAVGFAAHGVYCFCQSKYRRI